MEVDSIGIASDHAGFFLKEKIKKLLAGKVEIKDYGCTNSESVDYPNFCQTLALDISKRKTQAGIAVCGTGFGMSIVANKFSGVRAYCPWDEYTCKMGRLHNNANVLCLGARTLNHDRALDLVNLWLSTSFDQSNEKHLRRLDKITQIEKQTLKSH